MHKRFFRTLSVAACGVSLLSAVPALASEPSKAAQGKEETVIRPATFIAGEWSSMGMEAVEIAANRAAGPASRLIVHLPPSLQKSGQPVFSLARKEGNLWEAQDNKVTLTFKLVSDNFGVLSMTGDKPGHHFELPMSRY